MEYRFPFAHQMAQNTTLTDSDISAIQVVDKLLSDEPQLDREALQRFRVSGEALNKSLLFSDENFYWSHVNPLIGGHLTCWNMVSHSATCHTSMVRLITII